MIIDDPKVISYISPNNGSKGWMEPNDNMVEHQTFGSEGGDLSVGLYGVGFHWYVTLDGRIFQLWDTGAETWHCNGANRRAMGVEYESPAGGPLTPEQVDAGAYLHRLLTSKGLIADRFVDPDTTPFASIHVNSDYDFHGCISHYNVMTDDGSTQHTDRITQGEWDRMHTGGGQPAPTDPYVLGPGRPIVGPRTILINGGIDTFEIDTNGTLWWHHVDDKGVGHPSLKVLDEATKQPAQCDARYPEIEITPTPFGPFLTCHRKQIDVGGGPQFYQIRIVGFLFVARLL